MTVLLNRRATLLVGTLSIEGLRMSFTASKSLEKDPNTAEILVYNLAEKSRRAMQAKGATVILQAGYEATRSQAIVFSGDARLISHRLEGPDWVTKIECGDGEAAVAGTYVNESFAEGTVVFDVAEYLTRKLGIDKGNLGTQIHSLSRVLKGGMVAKGRAAAVLEKVLALEGFSFSIQNGRLQILRPDESNTETVYVLSASTGLVGSPEWHTPKEESKPAHLKVTTLLLPQVLPGRRVVLDARAAKGTFMVQKLTHRGDTHEGQWQTEMECVPASKDAPLVPGTTISPILVTRRLLAIDPILVTRPIPITIDPILVTP